MIDTKTTDTPPADRTVGAQLREAREQLGLTYRELAAITKIQSHFLEHLENDAFDEFPAEVFARGFLRSYARELRLDEDALLAAYGRQTGRRTTVAVAVVPEPTVAERASSAAPMTEPPRFARAVYAAAVAALIVLLAGAVLVFGSSADEGPSTATYTPDSQLDGWRPAPQGLDDWRTLREN